MNKFKQTPEFKSWLHKLKDNVAKASIVKRISKAEDGHFGDTKPVGQGVFEMRIALGPGYRVYYKQVGSVVYLLLVGGKKTGQQADIAKAIELAKLFKSE